MNINNNVNIADEIKSRCNIVDVIGRVVPLKRSGSNYKGVCPFHNEKTPSFVVSETKQIFTCFGCGATGDVLEFVKRYYNLDFKGAVEMLGREYGIDTSGAFRGGRRKEELYEINRQAAVFFYKAMREKANPGYTYMKQRGIGEDIMNRFGIGYADGQWDSLRDHLRKKGYDDAKLAELGLVSVSKGKVFDKFRNRVMFPIINTGGKVIGFGGRIIDEGEPKYLNSQESAIFHKKDNLYGMNLTGKEVRKEDSIILVEGYMDVISLYQNGVRNVSASLGTALTENHVRLIRRYTKNVILSYDADQAGQNAALRGLDILYKGGCRARVLKVTQGKDPDEFIRSNGKKAFTQLVNMAAPYGDFKLGMVRERYDLDDQEQRIEFLDEAVRVLKEMKPVEADIYIKKLAEETGISEGAIRFEYLGNNSQERDVEPYISPGGYAEDVQDNDDVTLLEQDVLKLMLLDTKYTDIPDDIEDFLFSSGTGKMLYQSMISADDGGRPLELDRLRDMLDEKGLRCLEEIEKKVVPPGTEDTIFRDCIEKARNDFLKEKEKEIITRLSLADEDENHDQIVDLTQQLIDIQKRIKKQRGTG